MPDADDSRGTSYRKQARDGTLPPVLGTVPGDEADSETRRAVVAYEAEPHVEPS
ncbi:hypothetical protein ACFWJW_04775 [Streptomyces sp. NPDC127097]|uniref:hypothetical protein n=1 Tax=Streptomyces sp. NPDC127097 TaxID=3347136 RepID=UPI003655D4E4